jgi:hypothetical protein
MWKTDWVFLGKSSIDGGLKPHLCQFTLGYTYTLMWKKHKTHPQIITAALFQPLFYLFSSSLRHWNAALVTAVSGKSQASAVAKGQNLGILEKCYAGSKEVGLCQGKVVTLPSGYD